MKLLVVPNVAGELGMVPKELQERQVEIRGRIHYSILNFGQHTQKGHGELRRL